MNSARRLFKATSLYYIKALRPEFSLTTGLPVGPETATLPTNDSSKPAQEQNPGHQRPEPERREYFRVEDRLILRYCTIAPDSVGRQPAESHFDNSEVFGLMRELRDIDHENHNVLRTLAEHHRELGQYLKGINRKIDLIASALAASDEVRHAQAPRDASISEMGIAFVADAPLALGTTLALELVLLPQHTGLALYGEVVANRDEEPARTVVTFLALRDSDRQVLARHVLQVQIAARRQHQGF